MKWNPSTKEIKTNNRNDEKDQHRNKDCQKEAEEQLIRVKSEIDCTHRNFFD